MARAVETHWPANRPLTGLVVTRYGHGVGPLKRIEAGEPSRPRARWPRDGARGDPGRLRTQGGGRFGGAPLKRFTESRSLERSVRRVRVR
jgi:glycerate 2-kinase